MITLRKKTLSIGLVIALVLVLFGLLSNPRLAHIATYATRPLWDSPPFGQNFSVVAFVPPPPNVNPALLCNAHGWQPAVNQTKLMNVVDYFVVVESSKTFTGLPKELVFEKNKARFDFVKDKIRHVPLELDQYKPTDDPFKTESEMRGRTTMYLREKAGLGPGDRVIMSDVDEIPSESAIRLIKACGAGVPEKLHLRMRNFLYSFDFQQDANHWRAKIVTTPPASVGLDKFFYKHSKESDIILSDAGWHCSFCFPRISDFIFKMKAYSHADRVSSAHLLDPNRIQRVICEGTDIFDMLPEAYSFKELAWKWGPLKRLESAVSVPKYLVESVALGDTRFSYLLPGGCVRKE
ncbi:glycosyl transferase [Rhizoclosmatium globosum]|uniref:Glycosyl transferase n=1 Tax=Rhizoclosmatium globosum TaxID=329046 RepID=A0A1Y2B341_9FUNG|nr:glycosyl transferase [Rhizoclosmatium globosum]|eukprot:ORY29258.1 glycosyl transferase [Rhizoclosmatium globosum]